jgi:hypothetical protein
MSECVCRCPECYKYEIHAGVPWSERLAGVLYRIDLVLFRWAQKLDPAGLSYPRGRLSIENEPTEL